jgi:hypothetical protein
MLASFEEGDYVIERPAESYGRKLVPVTDEYEPFDIVPINGAEKVCH